MRHLLTALHLALAFAASDTKLPCKASIFEDNITYCIVEDRTDLPSFPDDAEYEIFYCSHPVDANVEVSKAMGFIHTSIGFKERNGTKVFNFEFWALHFSPKGIAVPTIENRTLEWNSKGVVTWASVQSPEVWDKQISLGFTSGKVLGQFMDWVHQWHETHLYYQLFSAWSQPEVGANMQRYFDDTTCNTFTEDGLTELHRLGAPLKSEEVLCRTYISFVAAGPLEPVGSSYDDASRLEMFAYYDALGSILDKFKDRSLLKVLELVGVAIMEKHKPFAFVYDRQSDQYYKATLQSPYLEVWPMYIAQRMVLPWQPAEAAVSKECDPWGVSHERNVIV